MPALVAVPSSDSKTFQIKSFNLLVILSEILHLKKNASISFGSRQEKDPTSLIKETYLLLIFVTPHHPHTQHALKGQSGDFSSDLPSNQSQSTDVFVQAVKMVSQS